MNMAMYEFFVIIMPYFVHARISDISSKHYEEFKYFNPLLELI